mgnify:FL=1
MSSVKSKIKSILERLSFCTGVVILALCVPFYILSFAQMALPISAAVKGVLWFVLFGLAKLTQYTGLTIIGVEGWQMLKSKFSKKRE